MDIYNAVCDGDLDTISKYYKIGGEKNVRQNGESLLMAALRNRQLDAVQILIENGEMLGEDEDCSELMKEIYEPESERIEKYFRRHPKKNNWGLQLQIRNFILEDSKYYSVVTSPDFPEFEAVVYPGQCYTAYYAFCEWLRKNPSIQ